MSIWINVSEELPTKGSNVIAWAPDGKDQIKDLMMQVLFDGRDFNYGGYYTNQLKGVTHWMYLPNPPEDFDMYEEWRNNK